MDYFPRVQVAEPSADLRGHLKDSFLRDRCLTFLALLDKIGPVATRTFFHNDVQFAQMLERVYALDQVRVLNALHNFSLADEQTKLVLAQLLQADLHDKLGAIRFPCDPKDFSEATLAYFFANLVLLELPVSPLAVAVQSDGESDRANCADENPDYHGGSAFAGRRWYWWTVSDCVSWD